MATAPNVFNNGSTLTPAVTVGTNAPPSFEQTLANWSANLSNALTMYNAQVQMDRDQQGVAFASAVETKGNQMVMGVIQNIR